MDIDSSSTSHESYVEPPSSTGVIESSAQQEHSAPSSQSSQLNQIANVIDTNAIINSNVRNDSRKTHYAVVNDAEHKAKQIGYSMNNIADSYVPALFATFAVSSQETLQPLLNTKLLNTAVLVNYAEKFSITITYYWSTRELCIRQQMSMGE